jgi:bifunctional DNA-binding transcriptional regulator/antitoxin component of YhaV-PrlF toxin-antitoxin module
MIVKPKEDLRKMLVKITAKRQVTFPARVLNVLGVQPGDNLELEIFRDEPHDQTLRD